MNFSLRKPLFYLTAICSFLGMAPFGHSLIVCDVDPYNPIEITVSEGEFSRIVVQDGAAVKVLFPASEDQEENYLKGEIEEESATVILKPQQPIIDPITIAVTLDNGTIQNFLVKTDERKSETVLLRTPKEEEINAAPYATSAIHDRAANFIKELLSGKTPKGYRRSDVTRARQVRLAEIRIEPIEVYEGVHDTVTVYEIKNESRSEADLQESQFRQSDALWSYLAKNKLKRFEKTTSIVATKEKRTK